MAEIRVCLKAIPAMKGYLVGVAADEDRPGELVAQVDWDTRDDPTDADWLPLSAIEVIKT